MVKGVNKTVIEVNNTGSKVFEKIVFYVNPNCGNLNARYLKKEMQNFTFQFDEKAGKGYKYKSLRARMLMRRRIFIGAIAAVAIALTTVLIMVL